MDSDCSVEFEPLEEMGTPGTGLSPPTVESVEECILLESGNLPNDISNGWTLNGKFIS